MAIRGRVPSSSHPGADSAASQRTSALSPLRIATFRALWLAQLGSMIGTWMQTVGAQWLLIDEPNAPTLVSLVQTASLLPMLLLALPAGVLADSLDRRRLLVAVQVCAVLVAGVLTVTTWLGDISPQVLLGLTFLLGCGQAMSMPPWQALIPDVVPRADLRAAAALGAVAMNLARAVGPALAGLLITRFDAAVVFALNTSSLVAMAVVLLLWAPLKRVSGDVPERFLPALRAGARYVRHSRVVRRQLLRAALFVVPASAVWALLPLVAKGQLGLGSGGYGVLLAALGVGAVGGAVLLPRAGDRLSTNALVFVSSVVFAAASVGVVLVADVVVVVLVLLPAGAAWLSVGSTISTTTQLFLPSWVRARGLSIAQIVFVGGQALGALVWGVVADVFGVTPALLAAAGVMLLGAATIPIWPLIDTSGFDPATTVYRPEPQLIAEPASDEGPVLITVTYTVPPENTEPYLAAMQRVQASRRRTGATRWYLYRDAAAPQCFVESFLVPSWDEHLRQHRERQTVVDHDIQREAQRLAGGPPVVAHLFRAR
jgi:MFS family permease